MPGAIEDRSSKSKLKLIIYSIISSIAISIAFDFLVFPECFTSLLLILLHSYVRIIRIRDSVLLSIYFLFTIRACCTLWCTSESPDIVTMITFNVKAIEPGFLLYNVYLWIAVRASGHSQKSMVLPRVTTFTTGQRNSIRWKSLRKIFSLNLKSSNIMVITDIVR